MTRSLVTYSIVVSLSLATLAAPSFGQQRHAKALRLAGSRAPSPGGIIGHQNDETPEGALIGGADRGIGWRADRSVAGRCDRT